jgi:hypothetical protein
MTATKLCGDRRARAAGVCNDTDQRSGLQARPINVPISVDHFRNGRLIVEAAAAAVAP